MRLVYDDHGVLAGVEQQRGAIGLVVEAFVGGEIVEGVALDTELEGGEKLLPHAVAKRGRRDDQHSLATLIDGFADQFTREKGLAESNLVGNHDSVAIAEDSLGPPHPVALERSEMDAWLVSSLGLLAKL